MWATNGQTLVNLYIYAPDERGFGVCYWSKRYKNGQKVVHQAKELEINEYCTDNWRAFVSVFTDENHKMRSSSPASLRAETTHCECVTGDL